jgi:hypothetical protein
MKTKINNILIISATALSSSLLTAALGYFAVVFYIVQPFHKQAVDQGFAAWEVVDTANGTTKFIWNDNVGPALHKTNPDIFEQISKPLVKE